MSMNGYTTGRDVTVQIFGNDGVMQSFSVRTRLNARQDTNDIRVKRFDGKIDILRIPDGWQGSLDYTRQDDRIDSYFANQEDSYYTGSDIPPAQITETIQEADGTVSQYRYTGVYFKLDDTGDKIGDDVVKMKISWMASRRLKVA